MANKTEKPIDSATAWFAVLESAKLRNDFEAAAEAIKQLRRLGVTVRFGHPTSRIAEDREAPA
jgi:hypothetical protein